MSYWHEYLDMAFFFKSVTGLVKVNPTVIPTRRRPVAEVFGRVFVFTAIFSERDYKI